MRGSLVQNPFSPGRILPQLFLFLVMTCAGLSSVSTAAAQNRLLRVRTGPWPGHFRVVLDLDRPCDFIHKTYTDPHRIAINLPGTTAPDLRLPTVSDPLLHRIRFNALSGPKGQIVLDLTAAHEYKIFTLPAGDGAPFRIVCDIMRPSHQPSEDPPDRPWTVVIDPGHGGRDPGASNHRFDLFEKNVVLDVSRRLQKELEKADDIVVHLTRESDRAIPLRDRVKIARGDRADVFVSIHVNGCPHRSARGAEVFYLSLKGATNTAAAELEDLENSAESIRDDPILGEIAEFPFATDLVMTDTMRRSSLLAEVTLEILGASRLTSTRGVKQANFAVLRSCGIPSALIELGFISNPEDARLLASSGHRQSLAETIARGLLEYRKRYARQVGSSD